MTGESFADAPSLDQDGGITAIVIPESGHPIREQQLDREALKVLYRLRDAGFKGYLVGGGVRDLYLGKAPKDFDISTDARPGQLRQMFRNSRTIGRRFRLVQVFFRGNKIIEVSTLRSRSEYDIEGEEQVLPSNNTFGTLEEDAFRRDLTINALFYEIEQHTIIDYTGGVRDLDDGIIRVVGDPDRRFTRDPVRMMRVVRHAARTGFTIEATTYAALREHAEKLRLCPPSRIRDEVLKDLQSGACRNWAELCMTAGLWPTLFPLYQPLLEGPDGARIRQELFDIFAVLDRLHAHRDPEEPVRIPESILFACLLLPWACQQFGLPEVNVRGQAFHRLSCELRDAIETAFGEPFNIQRMAKESLTTLLINLSTFRHARNQGNDPKWLKKKSYYHDCCRFYDLYLESRGFPALKTERFVVREAAASEPEPVASPPVTAAAAATPAASAPVKPTPPADLAPAPPPASGDGGGGARGRGRGGMNPAFSSSSSGVFGLRRPKP